MSRDLFLNIGLLAGAERRDDPVLRVARRPLRRAACPSPARSSGSHARCDASSRARRAIVRIAICPVLHANVAHDMVVSVQQPRFTELFGAEYRYSGAGAGYPFASVVGCGFTPFIAVALASFGGGSWRVAPSRRRVSGGRLPRLDARRRADARRPSASPTRVASRLRMRARRRSTDGTGSWASRKASRSSRRSTPRRPGSRRSIMEAERDN
ncbi:metabolite/H+ symporter, major facilitator superfamily [Burkholderia pseudomallei MSHR332]|nr:metabolite/H+ symporter, major facilitator superfamily [Burkholderia pseudomallei MSHR332]